MREYFVCCAEFYCSSPKKAGSPLIVHFPALLLHLFPSHFSSPSSFCIFFLSLFFCIFFLSLFFCIFFLSLFFCIFFLSLFFLYLFPLPLLLYLFPLPLLLYLFPLPLLLCHFSRSKKSNNHMKQQELHARTPPSLLRLLIGEAARDCKRAQKAAPGGSKEE